MKFIVDARETVFYTVEVEAESQEQLQSMISSGQIDFGDAFDGDNFMIDAIEEITNA
jgi:nicotinate-nucleotide pyrophosphorylase